MRSCCVCFEEDTHGVVCLSDHLTCKECFPTYVKSCYENGAKFRDQGFTIRCPYPECSSNPFNMSELRMNLPGSMMDNLFETLIYYNNLKASFESSCTVQERLLDAMNLKCPNCKSVSDPTPDGCCAVRCLTCGRHFCWLCFQECSNFRNCHAHVGMCSLNSAKDVFPPRAVVEAAHKHRRIKQIQAVLRAVHNVHQVNSLDWKSTNQTQTLLSECSVALKMNGLTPHNVLMTLIDDQLLSGVDIFYWINLNRDTLNVCIALVYLISVFWIVYPLRHTVKMSFIPVGCSILLQSYHLLTMILRYLPIVKRLKVNYDQMTVVNLGLIVLQGFTSFWCFILAKTSLNYTACNFTVLLIYCIPAYFLAGKGISLFLTWTEVCFPLMTLVSALYYWVYTETVFDHSKSYLAFGPLMLIYSTTMVGWSLNLPKSPYCGLIFVVHWLCFTHHVGVSLSFLIDVVS